MSSFGVIATVSLFFYYGTYQKIILKNQQIVSLLLYSDKIKMCHRWSTITIIISRIHQWQNKVPRLGHICHSERNQSQKRHKIFGEMDASIETYAKLPVVHEWNKCMEIMSDSLHPLVPTFLCIQLLIRQYFC